MQNSGDNQPEKSQFRATFYALGAIFLWATQAVVLAKQLPHLNILIFLTLSFVVAGVFHIVWLRHEIRRFISKNSYFNRKIKRVLTLSFVVAEIFHIVWLRHKIRRLISPNSHFNRKIRKDFLNNLHIPLGILAYFLYHLLLFSAIDFGPVVISNLLNFLWPLAFLIIAAKIFPTERHNGIESGILYTKMGLGFVGCILLVTNGGNIEFSKEFILSNLKGPIFGLLAAVVWATFSVIVKKYEGAPNASNTSVSWILYPLFAAAIGFSILSIVKLFNHNAFDTGEWRKAILPALYFGIGPLGLAMVWYDKAVHLTKADKLSRLIFLTPLISTGLLLFLNPEKLNFWVYLGGAFVIIVNMKFRDTWRGIILLICNIPSSHRLSFNSNSKDKRHPSIWTQRTMKIDTEESKSQ